MPDIAKINAVAAKLAPEGAEPAPEIVTAPPDGASDVGSAPAAAGGETPAATPEANAGATIDHAALERKLAADRARREEKTRRRQLEASEAAAKKARSEAEADRKSAADEKAKWIDAGKKRPWLDTIKEAGRDPREAFEEMKREALQAGTPEAKLEAMQRAFDARHEALEAQLKSEREARETDRKERDEERRQIAIERERVAFSTDFQRSVADARYASLTEEYEPERLFAIVDGLARAPQSLFAEADRLGVNLTADDGTFTMGDILNVLAETQQRHRAYVEEQRRKKSAAPHPSNGGQQPPAASKPNGTVNGTADRNAGTSLGNQLAATRATDAVSRKKESREERLARLGDKYG